MSDNDLIWRRDVLAACAPHYQETIAALPAMTIQQITAEVAKAVPAHDAAIREAAIRECADALRRVIDYAAFAGADPDEVDDAAINSYADYLLALIPKGVDHE